MVDNITISLVPKTPVATPSYTITYRAGQHGSLSGDTVQSVEQGKDGTPVEALPEAGYRFVRWSDGKTDNPRTERNVQGDLTVTAEFEAKEEEKTGLSHEPLENLSIHPNPTQSGVYVEAEGEVRVYSAEGYLVLTAVAAGEACLDLGSLPSGLYIIRVGNRVAKLVKR